MTNQRIKIVRSALTGNDLGFTQELEPNEDYRSNVEYAIIQGRKEYFFGNGNFAKVKFINWSELSSDEKEYYSQEIDKDIYELVNCEDFLVKKYKLEEL